jgi:hypothetical protein
MVTGCAEMRSVVSVCESIEVVNVVEDTVVLDVSSSVLDELEVGTTSATSAVVLVVSTEYDESSVVLKELGEGETAAAPLVTLLVSME